MGQMPGETGKPMDQVRVLREQVETAERETVSEREAASTVIAETIDQVAATAQHAAERVNTNYEMVAQNVRAHPLGAILVAAAAGFIVGRALR
jgi:ElaB/YqjD/DUF883 family membrane-anchored ribosome-binding protein